MRARLVVGAAGAVLAVAGCAGAPAGNGGAAGGDSGSPGVLSCPAEWDGASRLVVAMGDTASQRSESLVAERLAVVRKQLESAAGCAIPATVLWVPSQTTATTLFTGAVHRDGTNPKIRARLSRKLIDQEVMPAIQARVGDLTGVPAVAQSSPVGLFHVVADIASRGEGNALVVTILDNFVEQSKHLDANQPGFDAAAADAAVGTAEVPDLKGARISVMGAALTTDTTPAPDDWVDAVRGYADGLCEKTGATCTPATTQYLR